MTLYVDGLPETIRMVDARYHKSVHRRHLSFEGLSNFARLEDQAYCSRAQYIISTLQYSRTQRGSS